MRTIFSCGSASLTDKEQEKTQLFDSVSGSWLIRYFEWQNGQKMHKLQRIKAKASSFDSKISVNTRVSRGLTSFSFVGHQFLHFRFNNPQ